MICNIKDKKYQDLSGVVGEKIANEAILNNGGRYLEYDTSGRRSILYEDLQKIFGNKYRALNIKAQYLSDEFKLNHAEFLNNLTSIDFDDNGEIKAKVLLKYMNTIKSGTLGGALSAGSEIIGNKLLDLVKVEIEEYKKDFYSKTDAGRFLNYLKHKVNQYKFYIYDKDSLVEFEDIYKKIEQDLLDIDVYNSNPNNKYSHPKYALNLLDIADKVVDKTEKFIHKVKNDSYNIKDKKQFINTFVNYHKDFKFISELLLTLRIDINDTQTSLQQKDLIDKLNRIALEFDTSIKQKVMQFSINEIIEEFDLDKDSISEEIFNPDGTIKPFQRDTNLMANLERFLRTNFLDLSKQNNPIIQVLSKFIEGKSNYHSASLKVVSEKIQELANKIIGIDNSIFYQKKDGKILNRLIQKYNYDFSEYNFLKLNMDSKEGLFYDLDLANLNEVNKVLKSVFNYWDSNFIIDKPIKKNDQKYINWKRKFDELTIQLKNSVGDFNNHLFIKDQLRHHVVNNPFILKEAFLEYKKTKDIMSLNQLDIEKIINENGLLNDQLFNSTDAVIFSDIFDINLLQKSQLIGKNNLSDAYFDRYMKFDEFTDKHITLDWKEFNDKYYSKSEDIKNFYDYVLNISKENKTMLPKRNTYGEKTDEYDLYNADLTLEEEMNKNNSIFKSLLGSMFSSIAKLLYNSNPRTILRESITTGINQKGQKVWNYITDEFEYLIQKPSQEIISYEDASKDLANVFVQQTAAARMFETKKEIEPVAKFMIEYFKNATVVENGIEKNVYSESEVKMLDSIIKQTVYGTNDDPTEETDNYYMTSENASKYNELQIEVSNLQTQLLNPALNDQEKAIIAEELDIKTKEYIKIKNTAIKYSAIETIQSVNQFTKLTALGLKSSAAVADMFIGFISNVSEASTNTNFSADTFLASFFQVFGSLFGYNKKKLDVLMKLHNVDTKMSNLAALKGDEKSEYTMSSIAYFWFKLSSKLNILPVMISILKTKKIDVAGKEYTIWESFDEDGNFIHDEVYNPYITKDLFTEKNKFSNFGNNLSMEINDIIHDTHGNPAQQKKIKISATFWGRALMTFKMWIGQIADSLVSNEKLDLQKKGRRSGQLIATKNVFANMTKEDFIQTFLKLIAAPGKGLFLKQKTSFNGLNDLDSDQVVRLMTKIELLVIASQLIKLLIAWWDKEDEISYYYDEETNKKVKVRGKDKDYESSLGKYLFNATVRGAYEMSPLAPFSSIVGARESSIMPIINYAHNLYDFVKNNTMEIDAGIDRFNMENNMDDNIRSGLFKGNNKSLMKAIDLIPIVSGLKKDYSYFHDREYVLGFNK